MSKGWKEVARLGSAGACYPHILVDAHGWCLRLGRNSRQDEKYYSSLPALLQGLVEHFVRRHLISQTPVLDLRGLVAEVKGALRSALTLCSDALEKGALEEHVRRLEPPESRHLPETTPPALPVGPPTIQGVSRQERHLRIV